MLSLRGVFARTTSGGFNFDSVIGSQPLIAPFWDDVNVVNGGTIYYRQDNTSSVADQVQREINMQFSNTESFYPSLVFVATWDRVAAFGNVLIGLTNTFQVVIASDGQKTFVRFTYGDIQWGGTNTLIGVSAGDRLNFITHPASLNSSVLSLDNSTVTYQIDQRKFNKHILHACSEQVEPQTFIRI